MFYATPDPYLQSYLLSRYTRLRPRRSYILLLRGSHQITPLQQSSQAYGGSAHTIFRFRSLLGANEFLLDFGPLSALLDFGPLSALLDFGPLSASFGFQPVVGPLGFQLVVGLFWISARCRPLLDFGPLSTSFGFQPIVGPFLDFGPLLASFGFWPVVGPFWSLAHCRPF
jgi:hypothetical protein